MIADEHDANRRAAAQHTVAEHLRLTAAGRTDEWVTLFAPDAVLAIRADVHLRRPNQ